MVAEVSGLETAAGRAWPGDHVAWIRRVRAGHGCYLQAIYPYMLLAPSMPGSVQQMHSFLL